ncbi:MAG: hypothetical protein HWN67_19435 [Candidatus Helarchaeota archaeon]|nr:hypothetical protein [Candidatus Helarchaeota archaeon]
MTKLTVIDKDIGMDLISLNWTDQEIFSGLTSGSISATEEALSTKVKLKGGDILEDGSRVIYSNSKLLECFNIANNIFEEMSLEKPFPKFPELITVFHVGPPEIKEQDTAKIRRFGEILSESILIRKIIGEFSATRVPSQESVISVIRNSIKRWSSEGYNCWFTPEQLKIKFREELKNRIPSVIKRVYFTKFQQIEPITFFNSYKAQKAQKQIIKSIENDIDLYIGQTKVLNKIREEKDKNINKKFIKLVKSIPNLKIDLDKYHENLTFTIRCLNAEFLGTSNVPKRSFDMKEIDMIEAIKELNDEELSILKQPQFRTTGLNQETLSKYNIELSTSLEDLNVKKIKSQLEKEKEELIRNHQDATEIDNLISALTEIYILNQTKRHFEKRFGEIMGELKKVPDAYNEIIDQNEKIKEIAKSLNTNYIQNAINLVFDDFNENIEIFINNPEYFGLIEKSLMAEFKNFSDLFFKEIGPISILSDIIQKIDEQTDKTQEKQRKLLDLSILFLNNYLNKPIDSQAIKLFFDIIKRANLQDEFLNELKQYEISDKELTKGNQSFFIEVFESALTEKTIKQIPKSTPEGLANVRDDFLDSLLEIYLDVYNEIFGAIKKENNNFIFTSSKLLKIFLDQLIFFINILKYFYVLKALISEVENPQFKTINFPKVLPLIPPNFQCSSCIDCLIEGKELEEIFKIMKREAFKVIGEGETFFMESFSNIPNQLRKKNKDFKLNPIKNLEIILEYYELHNLNTKLVSMVKEKNFNVDALYAFPEGKGNGDFKEINLKKIKNNYVKVQKNIRKIADKEFDSLEKNLNNVIQKKYLKYTPKKYPDEKTIAETQNKLLKKNRRLFEIPYFALCNKIFIRTLIFDDRNLLPYGLDQKVKNQKINYNEKLDEIKINVESLNTLRKMLILEVITDESLKPFLVSKINYQDSVPIYSFPLKLSPTLIENLTEDELDKIFGKNILKSEDKSEIIGILFESIKLEEKEENFGSLILSHSFNILYEQYSDILDELANIGNKLHSKFEKDFFDELFYQTSRDIKNSISKLSE